MDDADRGLKFASLEFKSYRIVNLTLKTGEQFLFPPEELLQEDRWKVSLGLSDVTYSATSDIYIVPIFGQYEFMPDTSDESEDSKNPLLSAEGVIVGMFRFSDPNGADRELRDKLILNQTCAILLPYLRAAIGNLLSVAGYGSVPMPLINMAHLAESSHRKIIDPDGSASVGDQQKEHS